VGVAVLVLLWLWLAPDTRCLACTACALAPDSPQPPHLVVVDADHEEQ
jgi:hypothetical protein